MNGTNELEELKHYITRIFTSGDAEELREDCLNLIAHSLAKEATLDPRVEGHVFCTHNFYRFVFFRFRDKKLNEVAVRLFIQVWEKYQLIQKNEKIFIYGDPVAGVLSDIFNDEGDIGAAMRWVLLLAACELLRGKLSPSVRQRLLEWYALPEDAVNKLRNVGCNNRRLVVEAEDWSIPEAFAEDVIVKFLAEHQEYGVLFARHNATVNEFPLSKVYFNSLLAKTDNAELDAAEKGRSLEDLATYLTLLIPGWIPKRNVMTLNNEFESDIVVSNIMQAGNLNAELFGRNFLIECKNWKKSVGTAQVGYFLYRMHFTHTKFGIIFAYNGISGQNNDNEEKQSKSLIQRAFNEDGSICIYIDRNDLNNIKDGRKSFWAMIFEKANTIRFGDSNYRAHKSSPS